MASIHQQDGKRNWFCAFYDPEGFRRFRSTGTENKQIARKLCAAIDRASNLARKGNLSNEKALKLIRETGEAIGDDHGKIQSDAAQAVLRQSVEEFVRIAGGELQAFTVKSWLETWHHNKTDAAKATLLEYKRIIDLFVKHLGARSNRSINSLQQFQVEDFKQSLIKRVAPTTVNKAVKVLKAAFGNAVKTRVLEFSPAEHVEFIGVDSKERRAFTSAEIQKLMSAAKEEWRTMILLGFYTGLRLTDCANLNWEQISLVERLIDVTPKKTKRKNKRLVIPLSDPLTRHLNSIAGDNARAPLCPALAGKPASWLSAQFHAVMVAAGLAEGRDAKKKGAGKGRDSRRETSRISFHSLRYNTASGMRSENVSESVAMDIVGHNTTAIHRHYSSADLDAKRAAVNKLPDISL